MLVVSVVRQHVQGARLREAGGSASVGSEAKPEEFEVEGLDARAFVRDGLGVGVQCEFTELEKVERACGTGVLGLGVRDYAGEAFDPALQGLVSTGKEWAEMGIRLTRTTTPPQPRPLY